MPKVNWVVKLTRCQNIKFLAFTGFVVDAIKVFLEEIHIPKIEIGKIRPFEIKQTLSVPSLGRIMRILIIISQINALLSLQLNFYVLGKSRIPPTTTGVDVIKCFFRGEISKISKS